MTPGHLKRRGRLDICTEGLWTNAYDETCEQTVLGSAGARQRDATTATTPPFEYFNSKKLCHKMSKPSKLEGYKSDRCLVLYTFRRSLPLRQHRELDHGLRMGPGPGTGTEISLELCKEFDEHSLLFWRSIQISRQATRNPPCKQPW